MLYAILPNKINFMQNQIFFRIIMILLFLMVGFFLFYLMGHDFNKWIQAIPYALIGVLIYILQRKHHKS